MSGTRLLARGLDRSSLASTSRQTLQPQGQIRSSHIGASPLYLPPSTSLTVQSFPPHPDPSKPLPPSLASARSVLVQGPLGKVMVALHQGIKLDKTVADVPEGAAAPVAPAEDELERYDVSLEERSGPARGRDKKLEAKTRAYWGTTRALINNALAGVSEGHSLIIRLVGVGYRATVEANPSPQPTKLQQALAGSGRMFFASPEQEQAYRQLVAEQAAALPSQQRLVMRLGYSHPVHIPIPIGITCTTPQPTRITLKGVDKEALGLFAAKIRAWRPPEPYKVRGVVGWASIVAGPRCHAAPLFAGRHLTHSASLPSSHPTGQGHLHWRRNHQDQGSQEEVNGRIGLVSVPFRWWRSSFVPSRGLSACLPCFDFSAFIHERCNPDVGSPRALRYDLD